MGPPEPKDFMLYYALASIAVLLVVAVYPRKRRGMRLRLGGWRRAGGALVVTRPPQPERPLNVIFNYNGESWDAFEVLGLPAGSSLKTVAAAYAEESSKADPGMRPFLEAAFKAIETQVGAKRAAGG